MARGRKPKKRNHLKRANGSGTVYKLSGNRRRPWVAAVSDGIEYNPETRKGKMKQVIIGYYAEEVEAVRALEHFVLDPYDLSKPKTFEEVYSEWTSRYFPTLKNESCQRTIVSAYNYSAPLYKRKINEITITMLEDTISNADVGTATKGRMKSMYNLMYDYAVKSQYVKINIARQFAIKGIYEQIQKEQKEKIPFSAEHIKLCHEAYDYGFMRMILIGIYTGLRPDELCILEKENIHLDDNYMIGGEKTNAGTDRYIPIHPYIKPYIEYYYNRSKGKFLIEAYDGQNNTIMTYDKYRRRFSKCMKYINADGLYTPHCTRYTFVTKAKKCKLEDIAIKLIVGHEIDDITEKYTKREASYLHEQMGLFSYEDLLVTDC